MAPKGAAGLGSVGWQPKGRFGGGCGGRSGEKGRGVLSTQAGGCWWGLAEPREGFGGLFWQGCLLGGVVMGKGRPGVSFQKRC